MNNNCKLVKLRKPIDNHFNFSLLGIQVLSMSKDLGQFMMTFQRLMVVKKFLVQFNHILL